MLDRGICIYKCYSRFNRRGGGTIAIVARVAEQLIQNADSHGNWRHCPNIRYERVFLSNHCSFLRITCDRHIVAHHNCLPTVAKNFHPALPHAYVIPMHSIQSEKTKKWVLSARSAEVAELGDVKIEQFPFRIGRFNQLELTLARRTVSGNHAIITEAHDNIYIEDSDSRNGTFVNGDKIGEKTIIRRGDLIQIAQAVFRVQNNDTEEVFARTINPLIADNALAIVEFDRLMADELVIPHYQSIVDIESGDVLGYEALARGENETLRSPKDMFGAAAKMQQEAALSRMLRRVATAMFAELDLDCKLFLNSHPSEIDDAKQMVESLVELREGGPDRQIVLEIHEATVTNLAQMQMIGSELKQLDIDIAYDDFGAGQARFFELIEEPPKYLKFDIRLMKDLHKASDRRRRTIDGLVKMMHSLGITCLAEGIEVEEEGLACQDLGFQLAQGFYYSHPLTYQQLKQGQCS